MSRATLGKGGLVPMSVCRLSVIALLLVSMVGAAGCDSLPIPNRLDPTPLRPAIAQIMISGPSSPASAGQSIQFTGTVVFVDGATQDVTADAQWSSSNPSVATVASGAMRALTPGETEIRATYENVTGRVLVRVVAGN
jgi:Bacterial Ig-like domain (group 2)